MSPSRPLIAILALALSVAAQSPGKALRVESRSLLADVKSTSKATLVDVRDELDASLGTFAAGGLSPREVLEATIDTVSQHRIAFEDAVIASCEDLAVEGTAILASLSTGDDPVAPGDAFIFDFMAGGGGVWDWHVTRLDVELDRFDARLVKLLADHVDAIEDASFALAAPIAITARLPELGTTHAAVDPPFLPVTSATVAEPSRLVALARYVDGDGDEDIVYGVHAPSGNYALTVACSGGDTYTFFSIFPIAPTSIMVFDASELFAVETNVVTIEIDPDGGGHAAHAQALEKPALGAPKQPILSKTFAKESRNAMRQIRKRASTATKLLRQQLAVAKSAMNSGPTSPDEAIALGFEALVSARNTYAFGREVDLSNMAGIVFTGMTDAGVTSPSDLTDDLRLNGRGRYAKAAAAMHRTDVRAQARFTKLFHRFRQSLQKQAAKVDPTFSATAVIGRCVPSDMPLLSPPGTGAFTEPRVRVHVSDVVMSNWLVDEAAQFDVLAAGATAPVDGDDFDVTLIDVIDEETSETVEPGAGGVGWITTEPSTPSPVFAVVAGPSLTLRTKWLTINPPFAALD